MSTHKRDPLLSDDEIERYSMMYTVPTRWEAERALKYAKAIYEAARAKDAELIQMALDMAEYINDEVGSFPSVDAFRSAANAAGFKPSDQ